MNNDDRRRRKLANDQERSKDFDDSFQDQRNPPRGVSNQPRHWQGPSSGESNSGRDEDVDFDRRSYGRGNQFGQAGEYGRAYEHATGARRAIAQP